MPPPHDGLPRNFRLHAIPGAAERQLECGVGNHSYHPMPGLTYEADTPIYRADAAGDEYIYTCPRHAQSVLTDWAEWLKCLPGHPTLLLATDWHIDVDYVPLKGDTSPDGKPFPPGRERLVQVHRKVDVHTWHTWETSIPKNTPVAEELTTALRQLREDGCIDA